MTMRELDGRLAVGGDVLETFGVTHEQLADMGLRTFMEMAMDRGYDVEIAMSMARGREGRLTVEVTPPALSPEHERGR